jgi:hypothetical protein
MPTRAELRDVIRGQTLVEPDDYGDAKVNSLINQAIRDISIRFHWPYLATSTTIAVVQDTDSYALPATCDRVASVQLAGVAVPLAEISYSTAFSEDGALPPSGTPEAYFLWGSDLVLRPVPAAAGTITLYYFRQPTELANDNESPEFAKAFHFLVVDWVMQQLWEREEEFEKAAVYAQRYALGVESMARFYLNRAKDAPLAIGLPARTRRRPGPRMPWLEV